MRPTIGFIEITDCMNSSVTPLSFSHWARRQVIDAPSTCAFFFFFFFYFLFFFFFFFGFFGFFFFFLTPRPAVRQVLRFGERHAAAAASWAGLLAVDD